MIAEDPSMDRVMNEKGSLFIDRLSQISLIEMKGVLTNRSEYMILSCT